ncbi:Transmembrane 7 superfamily member 3 [Eufriesea mexicana]|uniref:Transmembrane 7 superfamily member 3 n=1 Tax=Eufriesea mexicana TaxID=516756 RepID=A0A310SWY2_9HYME|nr:Transmembrane 7 superfamily member 3 [Eufriesea mexicana]
MSRSFVGELLIFLLLIIGTLAREKSSNISTFNDGSIFHMNLSDVQATPYMKDISIAASSNVIFNITNVSSDTSFIIFQIHVYQYNVTLSYDKDYLSKVSNRSVFGSNIGLLSRQATTGTTQLFVKNDNIHVVEALIVAVLYPSQAPVPGGCNMEFNTKIAPYMHVQTRDTMVIVDVQPASQPFNDTMRPICEKNLVNLTMYQMFLSEQDFSDEGYFAAIIKMLTVEDIKMNGHEVGSPLLSTSIRRIFSAYIGVPSVYVAVATYGNYSAAYVPNFSYGCNPVTDPSSCSILSTTSYKAVNALCLILGLLLIYRGPGFIEIDVVMPVFFTGTVFGYAIVANIGISLLIGLAVVVLWTIFYFCCPLIAKLAYAMTLGLFLSCVTYFHLPDICLIVLWTCLAACHLCRYIFKTYRKGNEEERKPLLRFNFNVKETRPLEWKYRSFCTGFLRPNVPH